MHHFIVGKRQYKIFAKGIDQAEGHIIMVIFPMHRLSLHVGERVVHPAHVPFKSETQATTRHRMADPAKICRLFGYHQNARIIEVNPAVNLPQQLNGIQIFATTILIWNPLALFPAVIEVEH